MEKKSFFENPNDRFDTEMRFKALRDAEENHLAKANEEDRLAVSSQDESLVSDWIRRRIEVPEDMVPGYVHKKVELAKQPEGDYEEDLKKLKSLTKEELRTILNEVIVKSKKGQGLFSRGHLLNGYVIDRKSLESLQSVHHDGIEYILARTIMGKMRDYDQIPDLHETLEYIVKGVVYLKVPGFKTPIVELWFGSEEAGDKVPDDDINKISMLLKSEKQLLPISSYLEVL